MLRFEFVLSNHQRFFERIIAQYFKGEQKQDVFQEFSLHLYGLYQQKFPNDAHLFDSKAWLRTILVNFCISQIRKEQAQKNSVWTKTSSLVILKSDELVQFSEDDIQNLYTAALGCVSKKEALILKMKFEYKCTAKEIERRLGVQHADVLIARIKEKVRKKMGRIDLEF